MSQSVAEVSQWLNISKCRVVWMALFGDLPYYWSDDNYMVFDPKHLDTWLASKEVTVGGRAPGRFEMWLDERGW